MNSILKQIIPSVWLAASLAFPADVSAQSLTPSQIGQVNSGLFRSSSQDFFEQGNRQREREIAIFLLPKNVASRVNILEIDETLRSQLCREDFQISLQYSDTISADVSSLNAKLKEICTHD